MHKTITTADICRARDIRIERLQKLLHKKPGSLILFTLNIPGPVKDSFLYRKIFNQGIIAIKTALTRSGTTYNIEQMLELVTGPEAYLTVLDTNLYKIKKIISNIEETHPLGRIFDMDLFDTHLNQIKSGRSMRKCFICSRPAFECSRSRRHSIDDLLDKIRIMAEEYFDSIFWKIASTATRAMITEVLVTPKPGLVDRLRA